MVHRGYGRKILSIETLNIIKEATQEGTSVSFKAITSELLKRDRRFGFYLSEDDQPNNYLRRMLDGFELLGLVSRCISIDSQGETWIGTRWSDIPLEDGLGRTNPVSGSGGGGSRNGDNLIQNGGGDNGGGKGAGYRELLSHPNLFSLPSSEFDDLLAQIVK